MDRLGLESVRPASAEPVKQHAEDALFSKAEMDAWHRRVRPHCAATGNDAAMMPDVLSLGR